MWGSTSDTGTRPRRRLVAALVAVLALCVVWILALVDRDTAQAAETACTPTCVILIQVDGLEPKDVTQATTPYLWSLAHPPATPGGALAGRSGWIWQAPRGVVSTGTASATASLLTGGYPEKSGVPSDEYFDPRGASTHQRLGAGGFGDTADPAQDPVSADGAAPISSAGVPTIIEAVGPADSAVFVGDPGLAEVAHARGSDARVFWYPPGDVTGTNASAAEFPQFTGDPRLCPIPRYPDGGDGEDTEGSPGEPSHCPANDFTTLNKAARDLTATTAGSVKFAFIELAELGAAKRRAGDPDVSPDNAPPSPPQALAHTDAAIATFVEQYAQSAGTSEKWDNTVLMVVGSHGYQTTPIVNRVPDPTAPSPPDATDPTPRDLANYVNDFTVPGVVGQGGLELVPQGTMATIYFKFQNPKAPTADELARRKLALAAIRTDLLRANEGSVNKACEGRNSQLGACIAEVLYLDKDTPETSDTVDVKHPSWHLDVRDPDKGFRTGASGDLAVILTRGWAAGRAVGAPGAHGTLEEREVSNPYTASGGGPQERAVAALINGPSGPVDSHPGAVRNLGTVPRFPVSNTSVDPSRADNPPSAANPKCPQGPPSDQSADLGGLACANNPTKVGDDAEDPGHEAQPVTVDFAITISALMGVAFEDHPDQLQGRVLQEAFLGQLATPCVGDSCEPPEPDPEPEPPPLPPPPPPEVVRGPEFDFYGLVRGLKARVVDAGNKTFAKAKPGTRLSSIRLEGDFGKPESAMTLTFYRATGAKKARGARRLALKAIARFDPFVVKRGHVTIRLKVPALFTPTYVGVTVREIVRPGKGMGNAASGPCTKLKTTKPVKFKCTGPSRAVIAPIVDAARLHKRKGRSRR